MKMKNLKLIVLLTCITLSTVIAQDQGITSSVHRQNVGKIVFANNLNTIAFKRENPSEFKKHFNAFDPIYARVYLEKSIGNTPHNGSKAYQVYLMYDMYIDGEKVDHKKSFGMWRSIPENDRTYFTEELTDHKKLNVWTSWRPTLLPNLEDDDLKYGVVNIQARAFALALLDLANGNHSVTLKMYSVDMANPDAVSDVLAEGTFSIEITSAFKKELAFKYAPPLPKDEWRGSDKSSVEADIINAFEVELRKKPIVSGIYGMDWKEGTYSLTGQRYRKVAGWAVFEDGDGDGQVPVTTFNFISDYAGGSWTKLRFDSHCLGCADWDVEVAAVKALNGN